MIHAKCVLDSRISDWMRNEIWPRNFQERPHIGDVIISGRQRRYGAAHAKILEIQWQTINLSQIQGDTGAIMIVVLGAVEKNLAKAKENYINLNGD